MGCIEITVQRHGRVPGGGLMETWDVLKWCRVGDISSERFKINGNMGCIEIPKGIRYKNRNGD